MQIYFDDLWWSFLLLAIGSYMVGNVNFAIIISKFKRKDIRKMGSGNPGTFNMSRTFGIKTGVATLVLDVLKGALPTLTARLAFSDMYFGTSSLEVSIMAQHFAGFFTVLGHIFPIYYKFKGGKGVATTIGVFLVAEPLVAVISGALAIIYILIRAMGSMGAVIAITPPAITSMIDLYLAAYEKEIIVEYGTIYFVSTVLLIFATVMLTWYALRKNIKRLLMGEEHETGWLDMLEEMRMKKERKRLVKKGVISDESKNDNKK